MQPKDEQAPRAPAPQPEGRAERSSIASSPAAPGESEAPGAAENPTATPDQAPAPTSAKRPLLPMAAFQHAPAKWLYVAGGVAALLVIALGAVLLFGGRSGRSTTGAPVQAAPETAAAAPSGSGASEPAGTAAPGSSSAPGSGTAPGGANPGNANPAGPAGVAPASVDALKALLIPPPGTDSTVDTEPITDTTFEGARWGVTLFWANPEGSMVLAQYGTTDEARSAISQYRDSVHQSGICDEQAVSGRTDAFLCVAKGLGEGVNPGDIPAIGLGLKGTVVALVTAADPTNVQQLLVKQLDRLP